MTRTEINRWRVRGYRQAYPFDTVAQCAGALGLPIAAVRWLRSVALVPTDEALMQVLRAGPPMRTHEITRRAGYDRSWTHMRLVRLEADGLVVRTGGRNNTTWRLAA